MREKIVDLELYQPWPVAYQLRYSILEKIKKGEDPLPDIQGRQGVKKDVLRALLSGAHPYLVSEEGTGKTRLARSLAKLLPSIPVIKGCPYNDDPKWPASLLCPKCRTSKNPIKEYGIELIRGEKRFSRIQGNEYTNEAKLLGLKDIQAIAQGKSPADPEVFTGTGVFRASRGILFVDELPAVRTKVQVLLHPVLEEKKAILEEYNWEHPLDLVLIATGNPQGFAHVNEVPRPLLDRLELIYMDLPEEKVEREIMLRERFRIKDYDQSVEPPGPVFYPALEALERRAVLPWWIMDVVNKAVRHSRICRWLDKKASIRGTTKGLDHTYASVELENRKVANLRDAYEGLRLALRGRIGLRADLIDFEKPKESFRKTDQVAEDLLWNAIENLDLHHEIDQEKLAGEVTSLFSDGLNDLTDKKLQRYQELKRLIGQMKKIGQEKTTDDLNEAEKELFCRPDKAHKKVSAEYNYSALETLVNLAWHKKMVEEEIIRGKVFVPQMLKW